MAKEREIFEKIVLGPVVLDYPHVDKPYAFNEKDGEAYRVLVRIQNADVKAYFLALCKDWLKKGYEANYDENDETGEVAINASSRYKVGTYNMQRAEVDPTEVYAGAEAYVSLNAFSYEFKRGRNSVEYGVSFGLRNIMLTGKGAEILRSGASDFADIPVSDECPF